MAHSLGFIFFIQFTPSPPVCIIFGPLLTYQLSFTCFAQSQPAFHFRLESVGFVACPSVAVTGEPYRPPRSKKERDSENELHSVRSGWPGRAAQNRLLLQQHMNTWESKFELFCPEGEMHRSSIMSHRPTGSTRETLYESGPPEPYGFQCESRLHLRFALACWALGGRLYLGILWALFCLLACLRSLMVDDRTAGRKVKIFEVLVSDRQDLFSKCYYLKDIRIKFGRSLI